MYQIITFNKINWKLKYLNKNINKLKQYKPRIKKE